MIKFSEKMSAGDEVILNPAIINSVFVGLSDMNTYSLRKKLFHRTIFFLFSINLVKGQTFKKEENASFVEGAKERGKKDIYYLLTIPIDSLKKFVSYRSIRGQTNSNERILNNNPLFNKIINIVLKEDKENHIKSIKSRKPISNKAKTKGPVETKTGVAQLRHCDIMNQTFLIHCFIKVVKPGFGNNLVHYETNKNKYINTDLSKLLALIEDKTTKTLYCLPVYFLKLKSDEKD